MLRSAPWLPKPVTTRVKTLKWLPTVTIEHQYLYGYRNR